MPGDQATISEAIAAASDGDTIVVSGGTYVENVFVYKRVTLTGVGMPVVDGSGKTYVFDVTVNGVTVQGFKVTNAGYGIRVTSNNNTIRNNKFVSIPYSGIKMNNAGGNNVTGNDLSYLNNHGIDLFMSDFNNVTGNNVSNDKGMGIQLYTSCHNNVTGNNASYAGQTGIQLTENSNYNNVSGNLAGNAGTSAGYGIDLEDSSDNLVTENTADSNYRYGVQVYGGTRNNVSYNVATRNYEGIRIDNADHITVIGNLASLTNTDNACGIHLSGATWCNVSENMAGYNTWGIEVSGGGYNNVSVNAASYNDANSGVGIYLYGTSNNIITANSVSSQRTGLYLYNANNNVIWANRVTGNGYNVGFDSGSQNRWNSTAPVSYVYGGSTHTGYAGNCWSGYSGTDANGDGIGDTAFIVATSNVDNYPLVSANYPLRLAEPDPVPSGGAVKNLRTGLNYTTIQAAVDAAVAGDTILAGKSTYAENVVVNKALNLTGIDLPVVDAGNNGEGFYVSADHVTVRGFNVTHASYGVKMTASYGNVTGNVVNGSEYGVYLDSGASHNNVTGNIACHCSYGGITLAGSANYNNVSVNAATGNDDGIKLYSARYNLIAGNNVSGNEVGLNLYDSGNNDIDGNLIDDCTDEGIHFNYCSDNNVTDNAIDHNPTGIYGYAAYHNLYAGNAFTSNDYAISLDGSGQSNFTMNVLTGNGVGIYFTASSDSVLWLNVLANTINAQRDSISVNRWNSTQPLTYGYGSSQYVNYTGNRWSDYAGADTDGNGIGDTPYVTGPASTRITDSYPVMAAVHEEPDTTAPETTATISGMPGNAGWYRDTVEVELSTGEPGDSANIYYLIDSATGPWNAYHGIFHLGDGIHTVRYYSVDLAGNAETPKSVTVKVDMVAPQVQSVTPAGGLTGVATTAIVTLTFSESMDTATIIAANVAVKNPSNQAVAGTLTYDAESRTATFTPSAALASATTYGITVSGPCDLAGNPIAAPYSSTFTTLVVPVDDAEYVYGAPSSMLSGSHRQANVTMRNTGNTVWTDADGYSFKISGIVVPIGNGIAVQPGEEHKFNFTWTADDVDKDTNMDYGVTMQKNSNFFGQTGYWHVTVKALVPDAAFVSATPSTIVSGYTYKVNVTMRNTGNTVWTDADGYSFKISGIVVPIGNGIAVQPGEEHNFTFDWTESDVTQDEYMRYGVTMQKDSNFFGQTGYWHVTVEARKPNAAYVAGAPSAMIAGNHYQANVTMRNTGNTVWTNADCYSFKISGIVVPIGNGIAVQPGEEHKFNFTWTADDVDKDTNMDYGVTMQKGGDFFGQPASWHVTIHPGTNDAGFVSATPSVMVGHREYRVNVTMENTGDTAWTDAGGYALKVANVKVAIGAGKTVQPGEEYTFSFPWTAENLSEITDRVYSCRMEKSGTGFGEAGSWNVRITPTVFPIAHVVIRGVLTYQGTPVEGATISGIDGNYPDFSAVNTTDEYGRYTLDIGCGGHNIITFNMSYGGHDRSVQYETPIPWQTNPTGYYYVNNWNFEITDPSFTWNPAPTPTPAPTPAPTPDPSLPLLHLMLSGVVSYGGTPVQGATITGTDTYYVAYRGQGTTDAYGRYLIDIGSAPYHTITFEISYNGHTRSVQQQTPYTWTTNPTAYQYVNGWNFDIPEETPAPSWLTVGGSAVTVSGNTIAAPAGTDLSQYLSGGRLTFPAGTGMLTLDVAAATGANTGTITGIHVGSQANSNLNGAPATVSASADLTGLPAGAVSFNVSVAAPTTDRISAASGWLTSQGRTITGTPLAVVEVDKSGIANSDLVGGTAKFTVTMAKPADFSTSKRYTVIRHGDSGYEELTATIKSTTADTVTFEIISPNGFSEFILAETTALPTPTAAPTSPPSATPVPAPSFLPASLALIGGALVLAIARKK